MCFVHELEQLVDHSLEELPMCFKETRILSDDIHDIGGNNSFVILSSFDLAKSEEVLDNGNKEPLLLFLIWRNQL